MQDPRIAELEEIAARAIEAVAGATITDAAVPVFLLRRYLATDGDALRDTLGLALAQTLALAPTDDTAMGRAGWLTLLVEAAAIADDERIVPAAEQLVDASQRTWPALTRIDEVSASVDACLRATAILNPDGLVQDAIDHLERVIGGAYRPGDGLMRDRDGVRVRGSAGDHVRGAAALLTAYEISGRLPYSMLAEELIAIAARERRTDGNLAIECETARVLCRLAALHDDPDYRGAAVIAEGADYREQASRILATQSARARAGTPADAARYGVALDELLRHVR
ncbi:MAG: hypothetical protein JWL71_770 [Acidobacteria bacterium]|nr:hypothetical protein [Acidobacteriota bacterium]